MGQPLPVLVLDDGELDDIQSILEELCVPFGRVRGGAIVKGTPPPTNLLVSTPRRVNSVSAANPQGDRLTRIVVVNEDSNTLRAQLRESGFDFLVRRPVHPEALRLLLLHCLYSGEERRADPRVPVGFEVSFRTGVLPRKATLADLSARGCRLLSRYALEPGKRITLQIPEALGAAERLQLKGRVLRMSLDEHLGPDGPYSAAIQFEKMSSEARQELEWVLEERAKGPASLKLGDDPVRSPRERSNGDAELDETEDLQRVEMPVDVRMDHEIETTEPSPEPESVATPPEPDAFDEPEKTAAVAAPAIIEATAADLPAERRKAHRATYGRKVPAFGSRALRVLVARDLSMGGMRVDRCPGLELEDRLHLAIYGNANEEPILVWATVARDDGDEGVALVFDEVHATLAQKLEGIVSDLPAVESLHDDEVHAMGTVMTEILDD